MHTFCKYCWKSNDIFLVGKNLTLEFNFTSGIFEVWKNNLKEKVKKLRWETFYLDAIWEQESPILGLSKKYFFFKGY